MEFLILDSARKHGIADEDMLHAIDHALRTYQQDDDVLMHIGPNRAAVLLEIGTTFAVNIPGVILIVHAMQCRPKYLKGL